jgi:hypothetical protein
MQLAALEGIQPLAGEDYHIQCREFMLMQTKRLAHDTPNTVPFHRSADIFLCDYESDPGVTKIVATGQNQQVLVRYFDIGALEYAREIPARQQTQTAGKSEIGHSVG